MRRTTALITIPLLVALACLSLPKSLQESLQRFFATTCIAFFSHAPPPQHFSITPSLFFVLPDGSGLVAENLYLRLEQQRLESEIASLRALLRQPHRDGPAPQPHFRIASVIYRSLKSWSSTLWVNCGSADNPQVGPLIVAKNSPVLSKDALVGVVEYVGEHVSLVRLISDSSFTPAVRVARGSLASRAHLDTVRDVASLIHNHPHYLTQEEKRALLYLLSHLATTLSKETEATQFLAKGELQGHGEPFWRIPGTLLRGVGFNYDFRDADGPARDLRTGEPHSLLPEELPPPATPLILPGDLLVTSGLDGIFPRGLKVATVESITPLREGAYAYELIARPSAHDLFDLTSLTILPPLAAYPIKDTVELDRKG